MAKQIIVITGGPGTGKTTLIKALSKRNFCCFDEVSRHVTRHAQKQGIAQLFLTNPLLFSELILKERENQFLCAKQLSENTVFIDRGLPDVMAYMDFKKEGYPEQFTTLSSRYIYDAVFILKPWKKIYTQDNERYESFDESLNIHNYLENTYSNLGYHLFDVPFGNIQSRVDFILNKIPKL